MCCRCAFLLAFVKKECLLCLVCNVLLIGIVCWSASLCITGGVLLLLVDSLCVVSCVLLCAVSCVLWFVKVCRFTLFAVCRSLCLWFALLVVLVRLLRATYALYFVVGRCWC